MSRASLRKLRGQINQIVVVHALYVDRRRPGRKRLCLRCALAGTLDGGAGCSSMGQTGWPVNAIKHVDEGLFCHLRDRLDGFSARR